MDFNSPFRMLNGNACGSQNPLSVLTGPLGGPHAGASYAGEQPRIARCTKACDTCHKYHRYCDNKKPRCSECEKRGGDCTFANIPRRRGPKPRNLDKIAERVLAVVTRSDPTLEAAIIQEAMTGKDPKTGRLNITALQTPGDKDQLLGHFDRSRVANILYDHERGRYADITPSLNDARPIPGPLRRGINLLANSPSYARQERAAGGEERTVDPFVLQTPKIHPHSPAFRQNSPEGMWSTPGLSGQSSAAPLPDASLPAEAQTMASPYQRHEHRTLPSQEIARNTQHQDGQQIPDDDSFSEFDMFTTE